MFRRLKSNLGSFEYYFSQLVGLIPALFLVVFWLYIRNLGYTQLTREQIVFYFLLTAPLGFFFFHSFTQNVVEVLKDKPDKLWLTPKFTLLIFIEEFLFPLLVDGLPMMIILLLLALGFGVLSGAKIVQMLILFGLSLGNYIFLSVVMAIMSIYLKISDWISFFLRFVGVFWSGAYIPLALLPGSYGTGAALLPFAFGGLPLSVLLSDSVQWVFIISVVAYMVLFIFLVLLLIPRYRTFTQE